MLGSWFERALWSSLGDVPSFAPAAYQRKMPSVLFCKPLTSQTKRMMGMVAGGLHFYNTIRAGSFAWHSLQHSLHLVLTFPLQVAHDLSHKSLISPHSENEGPYHSRYIPFRSICHGLCPTRYPGLPLGSRSMWYSHACLLCKLPKRMHRRGSRRTMREGTLLLQSSCRRGYSKMHRPIWLGFASRRRLMRMVSVS